MNSHQFDRRVVHFIMVVYTVNFLYLYIKNNKYLIPCRQVNNSCLHKKYHNLKTRIKVEPRNLNLITIIIAISLCVEYKNILVFNITQ